MLCLELNLKTREPDLKLKGRFRVVARSSRMAGAGRGGGGGWDGKRGGGWGTEEEEAGDGEAGSGEAGTEGLRMEWRKGETGTEKRLGWREGTSGGHLFSSTLLSWGLCPRDGYRGYLLQGGPSTVKRWCLPRPFIHLVGKTLKSSFEMAIWGP